MRLPVIAALFLTILFTLTAIPSAPAQQDGFYVVASKTRLAQVVTVAKSGGDFTSIQTAVNSIADASADKPYVIVVGPGIYTGRVALKDYVSLVGGGEAFTILTSPGHSTMTSAYTLKTANYSEVKSLTVKNTGGEAYGVGIYNQGVGQKIIQVTVQASDAANSYAVLNYSETLNLLAEGAFIQDCSVTANARDEAIAILNEKVRTTLVNVRSEAGPATTASHGMVNSNSFAWGRQCQFEGTTSAVDCPLGFTRLVGCMLDGGASGVNFTCVQCYSGTYTPLGTGCL